MKKELESFNNFVREQGVVGLAVGFVLGGAIAKMVSAIVTDLINPLVGLLLGGVGDLDQRYLMVGTAKLMWGNFVGTAIDFVVIAAVIYYGIKLLGFEKSDKKK